MASKYKSDKEWKEILDPEVYHVTREKGTEAPFSGKLLNNKETGMYVCSNCGAELFSSETKYNSECGWPSFYQPTKEENIKYDEDNSLGIRRTEITCKNCGAHLGHVFQDGPRDKTGKRYCVNSLSLKFEALRRNNKD